MTYLRLTLDSITPHLPLSHAWWRPPRPTYGWWLLNNPQKTPLNNLHDRPLPYLRHPIFYPSSVSSPSVNKSTDGSGTPTSRIPAAKVVISAHHPYWLQPIKIDLDETYSTSPVQTLRKCAHRNLPSLAPEARSADIITTQVIAFSSMFFQANTTRMAFTPSQIRPHALPRPFVKTHHGARPK